MNNPHYETSSETLNMERMKRQKDIEDKIAKVDEAFQLGNLDVSLLPLANIIKAIYLGVEDLKEQVATLKGHKS